MKKHINTTLILSSVLAFGLIGSVALSSCKTDSSSSATAYNVTAETIEGVTIKLDKPAYEIGETVTFTVDFDATKISVEDVILTPAVKLFKLGNNKYKFIMPGEAVKIKAVAKEIVDLKGRLQDLKESRNYTVVSRITFTGSSYDSVVYYTENANLMHLENDANIIEVGEINSDEGVYDFEIYEDEQGVEQFDVSKVTYNSYKKGVKSFWERNHDHGGFQHLDLSYIGDTDAEYTFKNKEFENQANIFYNSGLNFSTYLSALQDIRVFINEKGNIQFNINLGKTGTVTEEIIHVGTTKIPRAEEYIQNGGKALPAVLTKDQEFVKASVSGNNYAEILPSVKGKDGNEILQGTIYYHPQYMFVDYTDEFLAFFKEANPGIDMCDNGIMQVKDKVYEFDVTYDAEKNPIFKLNENTVKTGNLPEVAGYLSETQFMKDYNYSTPDILQIGPSSYLPFDRIFDYEVARQCGETLFHLDPNQAQDEMVLSGSEGIGVTKIVDGTLLVIFINNGSAYALTYQDFGKTNVKLVQDKIAELEAK